jgi:hypothetical protein
VIVVRTHLAGSSAIQSVNAISNTQDSVADKGRCVAGDAHAKTDCGIKENAKKTARKTASWSEIDVRLVNRRR